MKNKRLIDDSKIKLNNTYLNLPEIFYSRQKPSEVPSSEIVILNNDLAEDLGLDLAFLESKTGAEFLSGNKILKDTHPIAQAYGGHQFGYFTMLGDGRAVLLGEYTDKRGRIYDLTLKGSGQTVYSRGGDGKAALGPMLREYIISEAMKGLNIPTTRALSVVSTGEWIYRERGRQQGAVLARIANSHLRVGTFQFAAKWCTLDDLKALADYALNRHYRDIPENVNPYEYLLKETIKKQASLIAKWQLVGFIHGVMNTDNMAISGESIDYGPCAFMDTYDPDTVFSSIDREGRYAYKNQPEMAAWNLARFAETLLPLLSDNHEEAVKIAQEAINEFGAEYHYYWYAGMRKKLGLFTAEEDDEALISELLKLMEKYKSDYTNTFLYLTLNDLSKIDIFEEEEFKIWHKKWRERLARKDQDFNDSIKLMKENNPTVIPRNLLVEDALNNAEENNDLSKFMQLLEAVKNPFNYEDIKWQYTEPPKHTGCAFKTYCGT